MKIKYIFATDEKTEVEVSDEIGTVILDSRREEHANNERHRYHTAFSLDNSDRGNLLSSGGNPESRLIAEENVREHRVMLSELTPAQKRRFEMLMDGMSIAEIARMENASFNSVKESIESARKKLKNLF